MKTRIFCPAHVEFLIHCRCTPGPFPRVDAGVYQDLIPQWIELGVIEKAEDWTPNRLSFRTTPLGTAWLNAICNTALPTVGFIDEHGAIIPT